MKRILALLRYAVLCTAVALLSGCATPYLLDNQVQSFSELNALPAQPTYRFERSLSQQADPRQQALEGIADPALHRAGLRRDDAAPKYAVQVGARTERVLSPYANPWGGWGGWSVGFAGHGVGLGFGGPWPYTDSYWFRREVTVLVRDLAANRVVFETHANNEGPIFDDPQVLAAMFDAAMAGFPNPPPGPRRVDMQLPPPPPRP